MAFADIIDWKVAKTGFGVEFNLYNGTNTITAKVCAEPHFGPTYQPCMTMCSEVSQEMRVGEPRSKISDFMWSIQNVSLQHGVGTQAHDSASALFYNAYHWKGQTVTVKLLALDTDGTIQTHTIWVGYITDCRWSDAEVTFEAVAAPNWILDQVLPTSVITREAYPGAPDSSIGTPLPIVFGNYEYTYNDGQNDAWNRVAEKCGITGCGVDAEFLLPCVCTDTNEDDETAGPVFHVAGHALYDPPNANAADGAGSVYLWVPSLDQMAIVYTTSSSVAAGYAVTNAADGCYVSFKNDWSINLHYYPHEVDNDSTATDPENAIDKDLSTYATLDSGHDKLYLDLKRPADLGRIVAARVYALVSYDIDAGKGEVGRIGLAEEDSDDNHVQYWPSETGYTDWTGTGTLEWKIYAPPVGALLNYANDFPNFSQLRMQLLNEDGGHIHVYAFCLVLRYAALKHLYGNPLSGVHPGSPAYWRPRYRDNPLVPCDEFPDATGGDRVFVAVEGMADDGSGTYTGSANSLIQLPGDVIYYLLATAGCNVNTSLTPADVTNVRTGPPVVAFRLGEYTSYDQLISDICRQTAMGLCCRFSANMEMGLVFWGQSPADNAYGTTIPWSDVLHDREMSIGRTSMVDVRNAFYLQINRSYKDNKFSRLVMLDGATSDNGNGTDWYSTSGASYTSFQALLADSETAYKRREMHMKAGYLRRITYPSSGPNAGPLIVIDEYAAMLHEPRASFRCALPWKYYALQVGHMVQPHNTSWLAAGMGHPKGMSWETHYCWLERVTFSPDGWIEIEASQQEEFFD